MGQTKYNPGPGEYVGNFENVTRQAPKFGFGTSGRQDSAEKLRAYIPGPGQYELKNVMGRDGPAKSMGSKPSIDSL